MSLHQAALAGPGSRTRAAGLIAASTGVSRVLGLVREQAFAALLGAGFYADAFNAAFKIPNLLRDLFAEGALSAALVPTYARALREGGVVQAHRLASRLVTALGVTLGALVLLAWVVTHPLVGLLAPGFERVPGKVDLTVDLTRVMLPFLPIVSFAAVLMGLLNAQERFGVPAIAPAMFNLVTIVWGALLWAVGCSPRQVAVGWAVGTLLGGVAQLAVQVMPLWREGWRLRLEWAPKDPALRAVAGLMAPALVGTAAVQLNLFVSLVFASREPSAVSWLQYAFRVLYVPLGVLGVAISTTTTTALAQRAVANDLEGLRGTLRRSLSAVVVVCAPATVGLVVLAHPIVRLLFERGQFGSVDTVHTAAALILYAAGLLAYTAIKVMAPAFYALGASRVPLGGSLVGVVTNVLVIVSLAPALGFRAIALGLALSSFANAAVLLAAFQVRVGGLTTGALLSVLARVVAASLLMGIAVSWMATCLERELGASGLLPRALIALLPVLGGGLVYLLAARAFRVPEVLRLAAYLWPRLRGLVRRHHPDSYW